MPESYTPSTGTVRARYHLATVPGDCPRNVVDMGRFESYDEFDRWLAQHEDAIRREERERAIRIVSRYEPLEWETLTDAKNWMVARIRLGRGE